VPLKQIEQIHESPVHARLAAGTISAVSLGAFWHCCRVWGAAPMSSAWRSTDRRYLGETTMAPSRREAGHTGTDDAWSEPQSLPRVDLHHVAGRDRVIPSAI